MITEKLEQFQRRLLDMSRRNRLLNFKPKGRRSVQIVELAPEEIYGWLALEQKTLEFAPADAHTNERDSSGSGDGAEAGSAQESYRSQTAASRRDRDVPVKPMPLPPHGVQTSPAAENTPPAAASASSSPAHSNRSPRIAKPAGQLPTDLDEESLEKRLLFLTREAESAMQEQGCNILYFAFGLLDWVDPNESGLKATAAPLVLMPVELVRRDAKQQYRVRAIEDEPVVNPTLVELCRSNFHLGLPEFDAESPDPLGGFLHAMEQLIAGPKFKGWAVRREVHLGLFSFAKLLMYLDLTPGRWPEGNALVEHPLVTRLCGLVDDEPQDAAPQDPAALDAELHPRDTFQVVDADSSQQTAIVSAKRGVNMVIEGPPGTGKSQTITNIIAEFLAAGKTILFVAEKAAALEVVKAKLDGVRLGEFALAMHSRQASKKAILEELDRALRFEAAAPAQQDGEADELFELRNRLNAYVRRLHERVEPLGVKRFDAMGYCAKLKDAPEAPFDLPNVRQWDRPRLKEAEERVAAWAGAMARVGPAEYHPWRGAGLADAPLPVRQRLPEQISGLSAAVEQAQSTGRKLAAKLQSKMPECRQHAERLVIVVDAIFKAPSITPASVLDRAWNDGRALAAELIAGGRRLAELRAELAARWQPAAQEVDWSDVAERRRLHGGSWFRWLWRSWRDDSRLIRSHLALGFNPSDLELLDDFAKFPEIKRLAAQIQQSQAQAERLFGGLWQGETSEWQRLENHVQAMTAIFELIARGESTAEAIASACDDSGRRDLSRLKKEFVLACNEMLQRRRELRDVLALDVATFLGGDAETTPFDTWLKRLAECRAAIDALNDWIDLRRRTKACQDAGLGELIAWCAKRAPFSESDAPLRAFQRQFYRLWIDASLDSWTEFRQLHGDDLERLIDRFRQVDRRCLKTSRERLVAMADGRRPQKGQSSAKTSRLGQLEAEVRRKRGLKPIRKLFSQLGDVVQALKPCFMMSPMSAAQYLEPGKLVFDLVIFDEASQVEPADALGAIARGRQVILVGDEKQLPPTNFFGAVNDADAEEDADDDDSIQTGDLESVLAMGRVCLRSRTMLRWHYRSRHSSLIEFSNEAFYDRELRVFPSPQISREQLGLSFRHVPDGVYFRGKGQYNAVEARAVAEAVIEHARKHPNVSLGVGAFSQAQQRAIEDELEALRRSNAESVLEEFFNLGKPETFFVKNLETIQGDERDVIFLSVGYGPDEHGRTSMNFGPLNREGGWRRLNVLVTRARRRCVLFSSLVADQLELKAATPRGVRALKDYLHFAQHGSLPAIRQHGEDHDSPFEADVCHELRSRGWSVHAQVGCAGFSIDLAVVDPQAPGRYLLGIECDGATYHSSATARDRDRLRQMVLEDLGWKIHRIWSTDWFERRAEAIEAMLRRLDDVLHVVDENSGSEDDVSQSSQQLIEDGKLDGAAKNATGSTAGSTVAAPTAEGNDSGVASDSAPTVPGMMAYTRYIFSSTGGRDQLLAMSGPQLIGLLSQIVAAEGPIHRDELGRVVAAGFHARYTGQVKSKFTIALEAGAAVKRFSIRDAFIWPPGMDRPAVRWRGSENAVTDANLICVEEIAEAAALVVQHEFGIPLDDLPVATLRAMGFKRIGSQLTELGRAGAQQALASRLIAADNAGFMVAANRSG